MSSSYCEGVTTFLGSSVPEGLGTLPRKTPGAAAHSQRSGGEDGGLVGANASSDTPRPMPREPATHFVWPGATRRCFALLLASPARRDEDLRGAHGVGGDGRGGVWVGRSGGVGLVVCVIVRLRGPSDLLWRRGAPQMIYVVVLASVLAVQNGAVLQMTGDAPTVHFGELGGSETLTLIHSPTEDKLTSSGTLEATDVRIAGTTTTVADLIGEVATLRQEIA